MHKSINNLILLETELKSKLNDFNKAKIVAVSKTFALEDILPLINHGHIHFGENKVQEAIEKWVQIKKDFTNVKLHMIGKLQTNKVKFILPLFDYLHSLDNLKLAKKISLEQQKSKKKLKIFIQVNIGNEDQKSGVNVSYLKEFYSICSKELNLNIIGLMCLPPNDDKTKIYFSQVQKLNEELGLKELSLGMSGDFLEAINVGSTFLRIGSKIFGNRF